MLPLFVLLAVKSCFGVATELHYSKCCDSDSVIEKQNSSYTCVLDLNKRTQIVANRTNFIERNEEGQCVDVENSVHLFRTDGTSSLQKVRDLDVKYYRKCCPLNYFYNRTTHGCVKSPHRLDTFFGESVVKVGLPECRIIEDINANLGNLLNGSFISNQKSFQHGLYCVDKDQNDLFVMRVCWNDYDEVCDRIRCIQKCCPDGQSFVNGAHCRNTFEHGLDFSAFPEIVYNHTDNFAVVHDGFVPPIYPLWPQTSEFHLDTNGTFSMKEGDALSKTNVTRSYRVDEKAYCVEYATKNYSDLKYVFFRRFPSQKASKFFYTGIAMSISCFFLALTILYYCLSDEKKTLFGKILISYCSASFAALIILSYLGLNMARPKKGATICVVSAFTIFYLTLAFVTWMNVMCIDIYCTFGSSRSFSSRQNKSKELKRFLLYSLHGWGTPLVLTIIPLIFYHIQTLPFELQVIVTEEKCFLFKGNGNYALFLFSTVPFAIIQICNLILFIKTSMYCWQVKKEISRMNDNHQMKGEKRQYFYKFRDRFGLLMKLFFIMGISFLFEVVSTFYDFKKTETTAIIEIIWDTFNCLQGVFIFIIFIFKMKVINKLKKKVGLKSLRKISLVSSGLTHTTSLPTFNKNHS